MIAFKLAFLAAVGWSLGCYLVAAVATVIKNTLASRAKGRDVRWPK